jgi:hypothetical protein
LLSAASIWLFEVVLPSPINRLDKEVEFIVKSGELTKELFVAFDNARLARDHTELELGEGPREKLELIRSFIDKPKDCAEDELEKLLETKWRVRFESWVSVGFGPSKYSRSTSVSEESPSELATVPGIFREKEVRVKFVIALF